ncbi:hypothetical protein ACIQPR_09040 [Streptomyces sp. NPDC091280]|uniref:hypothetical protein n=1 Tax=Streptomyces sp. NPDC091280 TaxID=3365984 RepID=UPI0038042A00
MPLPQWDRRCAVVHAGQPMPMEWAACVLLDGPEPDASWQHSVITALEDGWPVVNGRLAVLLPSPVGELGSWLRDAYTWADEIISTRAPVAGPGTPHAP